MPGAPPRHQRYFLRESIFCFFRALECSQQQQIAVRQNKKIPSCKQIIVEDWLDVVNYSSTFYMRINYLLCQSRNLSLHSAVDQCYNALFCFKF